MNSLNYSLILRHRLNNTTNNTAFLLISMPVTFISVFTRKKGGGLDLATSLAGCTRTSDPDYEETPFPYTESQ